MPGFVDIIDLRDCLLQIWLIEEIIMHDFLEKYPHLIMDDGISNVIVICWRPPELVDYVVDSRTDTDWWSLWTSHATEELRAEHNVRRSLQTSGNGCVATGAVLGCIYHTIR